MPATSASVQLQPNLLWAVHNLTHHKPHHIANRVADGFPNYTNLFTHNITYGTNSQPHHFTHIDNANIGHCTTTNSTAESQHNGNHHSRAWGRRGAGLPGAVLPQQEKINP
jgi:hypothetical protein